MPTKSWIQDRHTGKLIPREEYDRYQSDAPAIHGPIEAFVSPIDKTIIDDRAKLRDHNRKHGVTDRRDYSEDWFKRKAVEREQNITGQNAKAKQERIELIKHTLDQFQRRKR